MAGRNGDEPPSGPCVDHRISGRAQLDRCCGGSAHQTQEEEKKPAVHDDAGHQSNREQLPSGACGEKQRQLAGIWPATWGQGTAGKEGPAASTGARQLGGKSQLPGDPGAQAGEAGR